MRLFNLALVSMGAMFVVDARAAFIEWYEPIGLYAFPDTAPGFPGVGGYEFQNELYRTSVLNAQLNLPKFDSSLGELLSVTLEMRSSIRPALDYRHNGSDWVPNGYFPAYSHDPYDEVYYFGPLPYLANDASVSYRVNAQLSVDPLSPNLLPTAMGLTAFSSCAHRERTFIVTGVTCETNDANGFGVSQFNWDFNIFDVTPFIGLDDILLRASVNADVSGYCDYDDDSDYASQDVCRVDPSFDWTGFVRVGYIYNERTPGGDGGDGGGGTDPVPVPEPASAALLALGLAGLAASRRRRRNP